MNNYEELGICGEGAYGTVLKCKSKSRNKPVAIKRMKKTAIDAKAQRELGILQRLRHSNVVCLLDSFSDAKFLYLVFEYMDCDVMALMGAFEHGMPMARVRHLTAQTCRAISYCHREGIIHRDLKLENLLIDTKTDKIKLCDFGVARSIGDGGGEYTAYVATRWYRAPELLVPPPSSGGGGGGGAAADTGLQRVVRSNNVRYSFPVDAWGLGCIMAELVTGCPFYPGETDLKQLAIIKAHGGQGPGAVANCKEVLAKRVPQLNEHPDGFDLLKGFFQMRPDARITAAEALRHDFLAGNDGSDSDGSDDDAPKPKPKKKKHHKHHKHHKNHKGRRQSEGKGAASDSEIQTDVESMHDYSDDFEDPDYADESFESVS